MRTKRVQRPPPTRLHFARSRRGFSRRRVTHLATSGRFQEAERFLRLPKHERTPGAETPGVLIRVFPRLPFCRSVSTRNDVVSTDTNSWERKPGVKLTYCPFVSVRRVRRVCACPT